MLSYDFCSMNYSIVGDDYRLSNSQGHIEAVIIMTMNVSLTGG